MSSPNIQLPVAQSEPKRRVADPRQSKGPFVKYVGIGTKRTIQSHHWKALGVPPKDGQDEHDTHTWELSNQFLIPVSEFSDAQLDYLLCDDRDNRQAHNFLEVELNDDGEAVQVKS